MTPFAAISKESICSKVDEEKEITPERSAPVNTALIGCSSAAGVRFAENVAECPPDARPMPFGPTVIGTPASQSALSVTGAKEPPFTVRVCVTPSLVDMVMVSVKDSK